MQPKSPTLLIATSASRALVPYVPPPGAEQTRQRRSFWFRVDQAVNTLFVGAIVALMTAHTMFGLGNPAPVPVMDRLAPPTSSKFVTATATTGDLSISVAASGTVEPVRLIDVSTELSGTISKVLVENNDTVKAGQVLAELDPATLAIEFSRAQAQVAAAQARVKQAEAATVAAAKDLTRKRTLAARDLTPARELDNAAASSQQAKASVDALKAEVRAAEANLAIAKANLEKGRIVSPIDGIVLRRNVEPGQTVAASLQSPVLFRLAQDLDRMQIRVDVDEADALNVRKGQAASFTVQALRDRKLEARVDKLFVGPEVVQGVVTYKAILAFDNSKLGLRPGMTATADILVGDVKGGLLVPNAALRFQPPEDVAENQLLSAGSQLLGVPVGSANANSDSAPPAQRGPQAAGPNLRRVWIDEGGKPKPVDVETGATDGRMTEIVNGPLKPGQPVIVDLVTDAGTK
jgi:HlyD family secretion protein